MKAIVRIASLIGSVLFGLAVTNIIYLAFVFTDTDYDKAYVDVTDYVNFNMTSTGYEQIDQNVQALSVTNSNIALWTIGATLHALYDNTKPFRTTFSLSRPRWNFCTCCSKPSPILPKAWTRCVAGTPLTGTNP
jgi:hypothetical protein